MSDGPRFSNPGNGGSYNDDVFRWSGDTQRNVPGQQPGNQGNQGDRYIYDGSGQGQNNGGADNHDAFSRDRMPGPVRDGNGGDYAQTVVQKETCLDGTIVWNIVRANHVIFNQGDGGYDNSGSDQGADYRRNPQRDFRNADPDCNRLQQRNQTNYYDNGYNGTPYNGSYHQPDNYNYRQPDERYSYNYPQSDMYQQNSQQAEIMALRQQQMMTSEMRNREIGSMRQRQYDQQFERPNQIYQMSHHHRNIDEGLRIQLYNQGMHHALGRYPQPVMPYYGNDGCFGNGNGSRYGNYGDRYDSQYGGPCFGNNQAGVNLRIGPIRLRF